MVVVGDKVNYKGRTCRVVCTSGTDQTCVVRWKSGDHEVSSGWIPQDKVTKIPPLPTEESQSRP